MLSGARPDRKRSRQTGSCLKEHLLGRTLAEPVCQGTPWRRAGFNGSIPQIMPRIDSIRVIQVLALTLAAVSGARAGEFVFETGAARLVIRSDGFASSLIDKVNGKERLHPGGMAFAAASKAGRLFPASAVDQRGDLLHVTFGTSGV